MTKMSLLEKVYKIAEAEVFNYAKLRKSLSQPGVSVLLISPENYYPPPSSYEGAIPLFVIDDSRSKKSAWFKANKCLSNRRGLPVIRVFTSNGDLEVIRLWMAPKWKMVVYNPRNLFPAERDPDLREAVWASFRKF